MLQKFSSKMIHVFQMGLYPLFDMMGYLYGEGIRGVTHPPTHIWGEVLNLWNFKQTQSVIFDLSDKNLIDFN